ncbi:hypothetical protein K503DRAFT_703603 [Rhizopogon vinicolor AM-OR11-026]|uniref:Uncharacterized protein n=1 Tax=Rhizopogon vinicolor AM-OR11-026 TaxID=1314800 RepID=A0A1B7MFZ7_9AGAM|nr:hypothetical protein K503DRAFT_703603 [Rhizopogon vinicolor AM-OR11-026]
MTLEGHETTFDDSSDGTGEERTAVSISYFPHGKHMIGGSEDKTIRRWDLQAGKETGIMKGFEGHSRGIRCIDVSVDSKLLASGCGDSTTRVWNLDTGQLVAGRFQSADGSWTGGFSQDSKKLAVNSYCGLEVWGIQGQKLDVMQE